MAARASTVGRTGKQAKCPSEEKWMKQGHVYTTGMLLKVKKNKYGRILSDTGGPRDCHAERREADTERQVSYGIAYMQSLKKRAVVGSLSHV